MSSNNFVKVASSGSTVEAEQIVQLLKLNGISAYRQSEIMDIYTGNAMMGEDIMVAKQDQNTALKILKDFQPIKTNTSGYSRNFLPPLKPDTALRWGIIRERRAPL